jgi:hypothetical protein
MEPYRVLRRPARPPSRGRGRRRTGEPSSAVLPPLTQGGLPRAVGTWPKALALGAAPHGRGVGCASVPAPTSWLGRTDASDRGARSVQAESVQAESVQAEGVASPDARRASRGLAFGDREAPRPRSLALEAGGRP